MKAVRSIRGGKGEGHYGCPNMWMTPQEGRRRFDQL